MTKRQAQRILEELEQRKNNKPTFIDDDSNFPNQHRLVNDQARRICIQASRRSGKSYSCGLKMFRAAYDKPHSRILYLTLTRDSAKRIMFSEILAEINRMQKLNATPNLQALSYSLPNGSVIQCLGVDSDAKQAEKLLGMKLDLVIIDEAAFFRSDMHRLIDEVLAPALMDNRGQLIMISTTSHLTSSYYYKACHNEEPAKGWEVYPNWTAKDNPYMREQVEEEIEQMIERDPLIIETPYFKRMYLNEWVLDYDALVYKYSPERNDIRVEPAAKYSYILGIDLGYNDDTALSVLAYSKYDNVLYIVDEFSKSQMIVEDVAKEIKRLDSQYNFDVMVCDNASKQVVEELKKRYELPLQPAQKTDKRGYTELMNSDYITGKIKLTDKVPKLRDEYVNLVYDERKLVEGKYVEHPACANHLSDATLYGWRYCYNFIKNVKPVKVSANSEVKVNEFWDKQSEQLELDSNKRSIINELFDDDQF